MLILVKFQNFAISDNFGLSFIKTLKLFLNTFVFEHEKKHYFFPEGIEESSGKIFEAYIKFIENISNNHFHLLSVFYFC